MDVIQFDEEAIYHVARRIKDPEARDAYLRQVCEDAALRDRLDALLRVCEQEESFLESPAVGLPPAVSVAAAAPLAEGTGTTIGPYKLLEPIGEGGMGTVFMAEQSQPVRRKVALKVIKPGMDTSQVIARFEAERQALALMDHANIARVFDGGTTESGRPYFVMELVHGLPITDYCDREQLSITERLELFVLVCRAVQHAHQKGIIHRDLKPTNVLVTLHDGVPIPKVIDFGVAKAIGGGLTDKTIYTQLTQLVGTPLYMSPEQAELSGLDIDTRSDIYSLGVLLYELLTGTTPFDPESLKKAAFDEMLRIIREQEPPKPSTRLGKDASTTTSRFRTSSFILHPSSFQELDWIVMKALEKDRTRRYQTPSDFAHDVMRHLANQPVQACPPSRVYHLQKFVRRNRSRITALGLIGVLGTALAVGVVWQGIERAARRAETASAATQALDAAERSMRLAKWPEAMAAVSQAEALLGPGGGNDGLRQRTRRLRLDLAMVSRLDEIRQEMSVVTDDHFDTGLADRRYGEAFRDYGIDVETLSPEVVASRMPAGPVREEMIAALDDWMRIRRGMHNKDDSDWKRLLAAARAADPDPWRNRVREAWERGNRKALGDLASSAPFDRLHPCDVLLLEADLDTDRAVAVLREAQRRRPGDFWLNHALGMRLLGLPPARIDEALGYLRTAAALRPESPAAILNGGQALQQADRTIEAIAAYEQAIRLKPDYAMAYSNLGGVLSDAGRFDEAIRACREAIRLNPKSHRDHHNLGEALVATGGLDEAITELREAIRLDRGCPLAARHLAIACLKKVVAGPQFIHRVIDKHIVRLKSPRPFLQTLLDPRSLPMLRRHFVLKLLAASVLASPVLAGGIRYKFTSFDVPGEVGANSNGINNVGAIVGNCHDGTTGHGFLWSNGAFTLFDPPGSVSTSGQSINDAGTIVGTFDSPALYDHHGFILSGGQFTTIDVPGATWTGSKGINLAGVIVGYFIDAAGTYHGYLLNSGQFTTIDYPNASYTVCAKINDNGQFVGFYKDNAGNMHGFLLSGGKFTSLDYPKSTSSQAWGVNGAGQIVGYYTDRSGMTHGFLLSNGIYTSIDYPNATSTLATGINDNGEIVGGWTDAAGKNHGFYAVKQ
jgi:probable HAF family extracellular repeat protein